MSAEVERIREEIMELVHRWSGDDQLALFADPVDRLIAKLTAAQDTIQQRERELEEALEQAYERLMAETGDWGFDVDTKLIRAAILGVHSARAQQAEAKKEG